MEKCYVVYITETLQRGIGILADSHEDALNRVKAQYRNGAIVLGEEDIREVKFDEYLTVSNTRKKK